MVQMIKLTGGLIYTTDLEGTNSIEMNQLTSECWCMFLFTLISSSVESAGNVNKQLTAF